MSDSENKKDPAAKKQQEKNNTETSASGRRKLLKAGGVVASSALVPEKWQKPVVDTVLLPTHAQTSPSAPLVGPITIGRGMAVTPTRPAASMMAQSGTGILDTFINPAHAGAPGPTTPTPTAPTPTPTAPTPTPTAPTPTPTAPTPTPTAPTPTPTAPTPTPSAPTPTPCAALGQCVELYPPNASNQVPFTITNVGSGMLNMTGMLTYMGTVAGIDIDGYFTDQSFTESTGTASASGCPGIYSASIDGSCTPGAPVPTPTP